MNSDTEIWVIWDTATDTQASVAGFFSRESAVRQIEIWQERQRNGGRPDVDTTNLEPRQIK